MKTTNTTYKQTETSNFKVTRIDGVIDGPDYFETEEDVNNHINSEIEFNSDTDADSFSVENIGDWHERFKAMKKGLKLTNRDIAEITGNTYDSIKSTTQPNKDMPRMLKLTIVVYERMSKNS